MGLTEDSVYVKRYSNLFRSEYEFIRLLNWNFKLLCYSRNIFLSLWIVNRRARDAALSTQHTELITNSWAACYSGASEIGRDVIYAPPSPPMLLSGGPDTSLIKFVWSLVFRLWTSPLPRNFYLKMEFDRLHSCQGMYFCSGFTISKLYFSRISLELTFNLNWVDVGSLLTEWL